MHIIKGLYVFVYFVLIPNFCKKCVGRLEKKKRLMGDK